MMMRRFAKRLLAAMATLLAFNPAAAMAQNAPQERINQLIVYGDDACPPSTADEITVCARKDEAERFRIPKILRGSGLSPANEAWTERVRAYETVGATGVNSCSPVGTGGDTGCLTRLINNAFAEKANAPDVAFGELIAEERARRLATIDAAAAAEQSRVEEVEREYFARQQAEQDAAADSAEAGEATLPPSPQ